MRSPLGLASIGIGCVALIGHRFLPEFTLLAIIGLVIGLVDLAPKLGKDNTTWKEMVLSLAGVLICAMSFGPMVGGLVKPRAAVQTGKR